MSIGLFSKKKKKNYCKYQTKQVKTNLKKKEKNILYIIFLNYLGLRNKFSLQLIQVLKLIISAVLHQGWNTTENILIYDVYISLKV
jgi:hypothetical protein